MFTIFNAVGVVVAIIVSAKSDTCLNIYFIEEK